MLKVSLCLINYNSKSELINLLNSIELSNHIEISIIVFDNSATNELSFISKKNYPFDINVIWDGKNSGYFGRINDYLENIKNHLSDYYIYANCDLEFDKYFFEELLQLENKDDVIIAPKITNGDESINFNPKYIDKPKKYKIKLIYNIFKYKSLFKLYQFLSFYYNKLKPNKSKVDKVFDNIYCPHGALLIFNSKLILNECKNYPLFLFGEEIFLAEKANLFNVPICYLPKLKIFNVGEVSVGKMKNRNLYYVKSLKFILDEFY